MTRRHRSETEPGATPDPHAADPGEGTSDLPPRDTGEGRDVGAPAPVEDAATLRDRWLRAEADLQNYRRRAARDAEEGRRQAEERIMLEIIAALDDLDRALDAAPAAGAAESWTAGVRLVGQRLREALARDGVTVIDPTGQRFDPNLHEAVLEMAAPAGAAPGTVLQVVLKGYARAGRALRPARVVVARASAEA